MTADGPERKPAQESHEPHGILARHRGLAGRTALVSALTLLSRVLGFAREIIATAIFGDSSAVYDAFLTAWRVPNLFRRLLGEGALSTSLQTAITEVDGDRGDEAGRGLFVRTLALTAGILLVVTVGAILLVLELPDRMPLTGWEWLGRDPAPVRDLAARLLPFVTLACLAALLGGALNVRGHFAAPNLAPALMNVVWIGGLLHVGFAFAWSPESAAGSGAPDFDLQWRMARIVAWWVLLGGLVQLLVHLPATSRHGLALFRRRSEGRAATWGQAGAVLLAAAPLALGAAVYQVNVMIDGLMAESLLADGGPTALYKANRIQQLPLALLAIAATNAVFPALKAYAHVGRLDEVRRLFERSQRVVFLLALPAALGLFLLARPICAVLFLRGNYGWEGVERMAGALRMLALALLPAGATVLSTRAYYALGDFRTPVRVAALMLPVNAGLNVALVVGLGMDAAGLALGTAVASLGTLLLLGRRLGARLAGPSPGPAPLSLLGLRKGLLAMTAAGAASGLAAVGGHRAVGLFLGLGSDEAARSGAALLAGIALGVLGFLAAVRALGLSEWKELRERLGRRLGGR